MEKLSDKLERRSSKIGQVNGQLSRSYDATFKLMVINEAESSDNNTAADKYGVTDCNVQRWRAQKDLLKNAHSERKAFRGPQSGRSQELDRRVYAYAEEKEKDGMPISKVDIQLKAVEIAKELNIADFKASLGWFARMMRRTGLKLRSRKSIAQQPRRSYEANFKLMVIKEAESSNNNTAAEKYGVTECNVRRWRAQKDLLKNAHSERKAFRGPQSGRFRELDRRVCTYVDEKRKDRMPISRAAIRLKAVEIAKELNIADFKASIGWCRRMMKRHGVRLRDRTLLAQRLPSDFGEKLLSFQRHVISLRKKHSYLLDQIGNAEQTAVFFDMPTPVTVHEKGEESVILKSTGNEKSRVTVMLACLADGTKLPPYVVLKRKTEPKEATPAGIIVRAQEQGWMDTQLVVDWLKVVWGRRRGGLRKTRNMLILDAFCGHLSDPVKKQVKSMNGDLVIIPGGMTSQLQVLDAVVHKPFKDNLRKKYTEWLNALTPTGTFQKPSVRLLCEWILHAWDAISSKSIIQGFKKCLVSNALDGSEDDVLWEESAEQEVGSEDSDTENSEAEDVCEE